MVLPRQGLNDLGMGGLQAYQPMLGKESIWPAVVIQSTSPTLATASPTENAPQTHADPAVEPFEDPRWTTVLEVGEPALKRLVDVVDDILQRVTRGTLRFLADRILQLLHTLVARDSCVPFKEISQEGEAVHAGVHNLRLGRGQRQPV